MTSHFLARGRFWIVAQNALSFAVVALAVAFRGQWHSSIGFGIGWVFFAAAAALGIAGVCSLGPNRASSPEPKADSKLVVHGAFRLVRHPLYLSLIFAGIGWTF